MQYTVVENYLLFRGIPEMTDEIIRVRMVELISEFLNQGVEAVEAKINLVYRVRSFYAEKKNQPQDVIVQFIMGKKIKNGILREQFKNPLEIVWGGIIVMKELPRAMVQDRKNVKKLTEKLRKLNIRFRWEIPDELSFTYGDVKRSITTLEQMESFKGDYPKDFGQE